MADHLVDDPQLELFRQIANDATYTAFTLAEKYGLSDGQARTLIRIHGSSQEKLDKIIAAQPFP